MNKKKKYKKNDDYTKYTSYSDFFYKCFEFNNIKSENEKYEKCFKLIEDSKKIRSVREKDKAAYYYSIAEIYYYASKKEALQYNFSNGSIFNVSIVLEEKNRNYLKKIIMYKEISFDNYIKCLDIIKKTKTLNNFDRIQEGIRIMAQELSIIYYIINDLDKFLLYGKKAIEYGSLNSIYVFLKYYCDKQDLDNATTYYNLMDGYKIERFNNPYQITMIKKISYPIYYDLLYELGMYINSLNVAKQFKKYIIDNEIIENKREVIKPINLHIEKCQALINEVNNDKCNEDILSEYFDNEVLKMMSNDNKIYIITSLKIYEYIKTSKIAMDYSATLMPILKAIENIIFEIIAEKYHSFIIEKNNCYNIETKYIRNFINSDSNKIIERLEKLELGKAQSLIGYRYKDWENNETIIVNKYFNAFCSEHNIKNSKDVIIKMYNELDKLRNKRNLVAHKNRVLEECVKECYDILLNNIKFINFLYINFSFVFKEEND